jgi:hypothetical protein
MNERLKERIAEEWAMLDPVDPLRELLSDVIDVLSQPAQKSLKEMTEADFDAAHDIGQPAQEPVGKWTGKEIEWSDNPYKFKQGQFIPTAPQPRPWVGLTQDQFSKAIRLAEDGEYLVALELIQQCLRRANT